jgi:hypothetical protein
MGLIKWFLGRGGAKVIADFFGPQILGAREFFDSQLDYEKALCHWSVLGVIVGCTNRIAHASQNKRPDEAADLLMAVLDRIFGQSITGVNVCMKLAREADAYQNGERPKFDTEMYEHHQFLGAAHGEALLMKLTPPDQLFSLLVQQSEVLRAVRDNTSRRDTASRSKRDPGPQAPPQKHVLTEDQEEVLTRLRSANEFQLARSLEGAWEQGLHGRAPEESEAHVKMLDGTPIGEAIQSNQPARQAAPSAERILHSRKDSQSASTSGSPQGAMWTRLRRASLTPQQQLRAYEAARRATEVQEKDSQPSPPPAQADPPDEERPTLSDQEVRRGLFGAPGLQKKAERATEKAPYNEQQAWASQRTLKRLNSRISASKELRPLALTHRFWKPRVGPVIATEESPDGKIRVLAPEDEHPSSPTLFAQERSYKVYPYREGFKYSPDFICTCEEICKLDAANLAPRLAAFVATRGS